MKVIIAFFMISGAIASSVTTPNVDYELKKKVNIIVDIIKLGMFTPYHNDTELGIGFRRNDLDDAAVKNMLLKLKNKITSLIKEEKKTVTDIALFNSCFDKHPYIMSILMFACTTSLIYSSYRLIKLSRKKIKKDPSIINH